TAGIHRTMLLDQVRGEAYQAAIASSVKPGDVVLDFGAGSGILSMLAARAGARRVYALERTETPQLARQTVRLNGFDDRITVVHAAIETAILPEQVSLIVSEWLGTIGVDENLLAPLVLARDRWLRPAGRMLPELVTSWMAPVSDARTSAA